MHRKISGVFDTSNTLSPVTFLPEFTVRYCCGVITIHKAAPRRGTPWPASARQRRICQALDENNIALMNNVVPKGIPVEVPGAKLKMEICLVHSAGCVHWEFEFDSGMMRIFDGHGMKVEFSGDRENAGRFMFRGKGIRECRVIEGDWHVDAKEGIFCCALNDPGNAGASFEGEAAWEYAAEKKYAWWNEAFLLTRHLPELEERKRVELLTAMHQLLMFPEEPFYFDGNFSSWCKGMRKLKFGELLRAQLLKICRNVPVWNYNAKCYSGIDDGIRLPFRCDPQGNPLELDWLIALDNSASCIAAIEMFEYCNAMHDIGFLREHAFGFMKQVMQVVELSIVPENFGLALPYAPFPGGKADSFSSCGKNADRQLFFIHALCERLLKACDMLGVRVDPVWQDIVERLPRARGTWHLAPESPWGTAGQKICEMIP